MRETAVIRAASLLPFWETESPGGGHVRLAGVAPTPCPSGLSWNQRRIHVCLGRHSSAPRKKAMVRPGPQGVAVCGKEAALVGQGWL